jgi:hypothetical protein
VALVVEHVGDLGGDFRRRQFRALRKEADGFTATTVLDPNLKVDLMINIKNL